MIDKPQNNAEEGKEGDFKTKISNVKTDRSPSFTCQDIQAELLNQHSEDSNHDTLIAKMRDILKNRRKYQASCIHKMLTFVPSRL